MKYDAVLVFENMINEDDRFYGSPAKYDPLVRQKDSPIGNCWMHLRLVNPFAPI